MQQVKIATEQYNTEFESVSISTRKTLRCNSYILINQGTGNVIVNNVLTIAPGQNFAVTGQANEILNTDLNIIFLPGFNNRLILIQKKYV